MYICARVQKGVRLSTWYARGPTTLMINDYGDSGDAGIPHAGVGSCDRWNLGGYLGGYLAAYPQNHSASTSKLPAEFRYEGLTPNRKCVKGEKE